MSQCFAFLMFAVSLALLPWSANAQLFDATELSQAFRFPKEKLRIRDVTTATQNQSSDVIAAFFIDSEDNTFAQTSLVVGKQGLLLTDKMKEKLTAAIEQQSKAGIEKPNIRRLEFLDGAFGFVGTAAFGPGGSEEMAIASIPSRNVDVQMKVSVPYETPLDVTDATKAYHDALANADGFLTAAMEASMKAVVVRIAQGGALVNAQVPPNATPPPAAPAATATPVLTSTSVASQAPATPVAQTPALPAERKSLVWPWLVGIVALVLIVAVVLKRRA